MHARRPGHSVTLQKNATRSLRIRPSLAGHLSTLHSQDDVCICADEKFDDGVQLWPCSMFQLTTRNAGEHSVDSEEVGKALSTYAMTAC